jgi:chromosome segregation ATPase
MENIPEGLKWVVGTVVTILSVLGANLAWGKIREMKQARKYLEDDKRAESAAANRTEEIKGGFDLAQQFMERMDRQEARFNLRIDELRVEIAGLQKQIGDQREMIAVKDEQIKQLKEENERQRAVINDQAFEIHTLQSEAATLRAEVDALKLLVQKNHQNRNE